MRLGCSGCLGCFVTLALVALLVGGTVGVAARILAQPPTVPRVITPQDGPRAQQKLFDLARNARRGETVVLTEPELNALLARHLIGGRGLTLTAPTATLVGDDRIRVDGQSPTREVLQEATLGRLADLLPANWQTRPLWLRVGAHLRVETDGSRRQVRLEVDEFAIGRQRLPAPMLRMVLDPATMGMMQWTLPDYIERIDIEPGRVVFRPPPPRRDTGPSG
jgi:hypothetical protein